MWTGGTRFTIRGKSMGPRWGAYLDAMKGVMSNSRGKETYVVIFLRSLAECSNRCRWPERGEERGGRGRNMAREREWGEGRGHII